MAEAIPDSKKSQITRLSKKGIKNLALKDEQLLWVSSI
jgi:hypothetical protein